MKMENFRKIAFILQIYFCLSHAVPALPNKGEKIIMDVDAGTDDAMAILIALRNEKYFNGPPVIAITCLNGNTALKNVINNVQRTLQEADRLDIPIYVGSNDSLVDFVPTDGYFGEDGFGDVPYDKRSLKGTIRSQHAVLALIRYVTDFPGQITLFTLGPLTNAALAIKLYPTFIDNLNQLVILGGSFTGIGNVKPGVEFNFYMDPEATSIVLQKSHYKKVKILSWDCITKADLDLTWRKEVLGVSEDSNMKFINNIEAKSFLRDKVLWFRGDPMAVVAHFAPGVIKTIKPLKVSAVTCGEAKGGILTDYINDDIEKCNVQVILDIDSKKYKESLLSIFKLNQKKTNNYRYRLR